MFKYNSKMNPEDFECRGKIRYAVNSKKTDNLSTKK